MERSNIPKMLLLYLLPFIIVSILLIVTVVLSGSNEDNTDQVKLDSIHMKTLETEVRNNKLVIDSITKVYDNEIQVVKTFDDSTNVRLFIKLVKE